MSRTVLLSFVLLVAASLPVFAEPLQPHPAVVVAGQARTIDASTFIVGHPASPRWTAAPSANGAHPAVLVARQARTIDGNTFLVQPPAHVTWTTGPSAAPVVATAVATTPLR